MFGKVFVVLQEYHVVFQELFVVFADMGHRTLECSISRHTHATDRHTDNKEVREFSITVHKCQVHEALYSNKFCTT